MTLKASDLISLNRELCDGLIEMSVKGIFKRLSNDWREEKRINVLTTLEEEFCKGHCRAVTSLVNKVRSLHKPLKRRKCIMVHRQKEVGSSAYNC